MAHQPWEEERTGALTPGAGPGGGSAAPAFSFRMFSLPGEDLDETMSRGSG